MSAAMLEALKLADAALSGANMNMAVVRRKISEALAEQPAQGEAAIPRFDCLGEAAAAAVIAAAVAENVIGEHQMLGRFALEVWREVKAQGANDIAALTCVYHAGMTHIREAMGMPYETAVDVFGLAPPASAPSVPDAMPNPTDRQGEYSHGYANGWNACRAAMLAAAPEVKP